MISAEHQETGYPLQNHHHRNHPTKPETQNGCQTLLVFVSNLTAPLHHNVNESYTLTIPTWGPANLTAETVWGAMRGLETFSQLVCGDPLLVAMGLYIWDAPRFAHRGVLLDTSRDYYPVENILRTIGAISVNKMNVFHWHITDSHSFPLLVPSEPDLATKGRVLTCYIVLMMSTELCSLAWSMGLK
ncbi:hypothetical protein SO802_005915 [Lithocarpus litseifolius]|uniref:beta-N-acetylhexosaminidase n=1 Tax=Lithocarpus litseifolius TaxID=425828 RepID=A0AAW2DJG4_9ROSI